MTESTRDGGSSSPTGTDDLDWMLKVQAALDAAEVPLDDRHIWPDAFAEFNERYTRPSVVALGKLLLRKERS